MNIFKIRSFHRWAAKENLDDGQLMRIIQEMNSGLLDVNLGGGLYKKRVAKLGFGKRCSYRVLLVFRQDNRAIFLFGFAKNESDNIDQGQLAALKKLSQYYLNLTDDEITELINLGKLVEVKYVGEKTEDK